MIDNCNVFIEYGYIQNRDPIDIFFESIDQDPDWTRLDDVSEGGNNND